MPELPEVEVLRNYLMEAVSNRKITRLEFLDDSNKIYKSSRKEIESNLLNEKFTGSQRIGKYLFIKLSNKKWLFLHFGMTGSLELFHGNDIPAHTRFLLYFEDESRLAFKDPRKFGVIEIVEDMEKFLQQKGLGKDLLEITEQEFTNALRNRSTGIKAALLQQNKFAGIGNWIADEMLFEAGVHPDQPCNSLSEAKLKKLYKAAVKICREAIDADTHYGDFPDGFFYNYRREGAIHPDHPNSPVQRFKSGGRTTYIVPEKQKMRS